MDRRDTALGALAVLVVLAGCATLAGGGATTPADPTLTPAPVPTTATPPPTIRAPDRISNLSAVPRSRYVDAHPTCDRPPEAVVAIQVLALANDDGTTEGINTTWQFVAPLNRQGVGNFSTFVGRVRANYQPLLNAREVVFDPLNRNGDTATQHVLVVDTNGTVTTYTWQLRKQDRRPHEGCWMTLGIVQHRDQPFGR